MRTIKEQIDIVKKTLLPESRILDCLTEMTSLIEMFYIYLEENMHKKIMQKAAKALKKDAAHYKKEAKSAKGKHKKEELIERKEAISAAKDLTKRAKRAHEY